jgi:uroporphyrinogen decarboxylase
LQEDHVNKRENLLRALRRDRPEYVPFDLSLCPSLENELYKRTGNRDVESYFNLPYRSIEIAPTKYPVDYSRYFPDLPVNATIDEWGIGYLKGGMEHFYKFLHPMACFETPDEVNNFPLTDILKDYRWAEFARNVEEAKQDGLAAIYSAVQVFEPAWYLRGLENLLSDMICNEPMAAACLDRMTRIKADISQHVAAAGIDMIVFGDDVGTQQSMMMSPALWRKWLKPAMKTVIEAAKSINPEIIAYYHSDGVIYDIISDLIEIGVDVLNPVQPECMDPVKIKVLYGDKLSFWGTIGTQTTMPFGSPAEVEADVKHMIETVGEGGGLVIAPTHMLEPEVPWQNIETMVNAVVKYGKYPSG